jgi:hypothetical protein
LKPVLQLMLQAPDAQVAEPFIGTAQTTQDEPQADTLEPVLRQVPPQLVRPLLHMPPVHTGWLRPPPQATQVPMEATKPVLHVKPQPPLVQVRVPLVTTAHTSVHEPQPLTSVLRVRQVPEQLVCPAGQAVVQVPEAHTWFIPVSQTRPHIPQWLLSLLVLTQTPPQKVWPAGQTHALPVQVRPPLQTVPQVPQLLLSLASVRQVPEHAVCPAGHAHAPD